LPPKGRNPLFLLAFIGENATNEGVQDCASVRAVCKNCRHEAPSRRLPPPGSNRWQSQLQAPHRPPPPVRVSVGLSRVSRDRRTGGSQRQGGSCMPSGRPNSGSFAASPSGLPGSTFKVPRWWPSPVGPAFAGGE
jgi:hypothetical protein